MQPKRSEIQKRYLVQLHFFQDITHNGFDKMTTSFVNLPTEMQVEVINNISLYSDLKALRLVSKAFNHLTTPLMYYKIELLTDDVIGEKIPSEKQNNEMRSRIRSLLIQPTNLSFVRVLHTDSIGLMPTMLMDELLPFLKKDSLLEFRYTTHSRNRFPTPLQLEFLWGRQKRLQNLKFYSQMAYWLEGFLQEQKPSQNALLNAFTKLSIGEGYEFPTNVPRFLFWPLKNLDMRILKSLSLKGTFFHQEFTDVMDLFASQSFDNLTQLSFKGIIFEKTVSFNNVPKLKSLVIDHCDDAIDDANDLYTERLPFEFPDNFQLQSLTYWGYGKAEPLTHLLAQVKGLKKLVVGVSDGVFTNDQAVRDFTSAIMLHKDTLRLFELIGQYQAYTTLPQIFPTLRLQNLPHSYNGAWSTSPQLYNIFGLYADAAE